MSKAIALRDKIPSKIEIVTESGCWVWMGPLNKQGYGLVWDGKTRIAHRAVYEALVAQIPQGMLLCHRCDVPACVNPDHLFVGTQSDNLRDAYAKGRGKNQHVGKSHCINGHELSGGNVYIASRKNGKAQRVCRSCDNARSAIRYASKRRTAALAERPRD